MKWILSLYVSIFGIPTHAYHLKVDSYTKCHEAGQKFKTDVEKGSIRVRYICVPKLGNK